MSSGFISCKALRGDLVDIAPLACCHVKTVVTYSSCLLTLVNLCYYSSFYLISYTKEYCSLMLQDIRQASFIQKWKEETYCRCGCLISSLYYLHTDAVFYIATSIAICIFVTHLVAIYFTASYSLACLSLSLIHLLLLWHLHTIISSFLSPSHL